MRGAMLLKTPNVRQRAGRRRLTVICVVLALALISGLLGSLIRPGSDLPSRPSTGPFSYFPSG